MGHHPRLLISVWHPGNPLTPTARPTPKPTPTARPTPTPVATLIARPTPTPTPTARFSDAQSWGSSICQDLCHHCATVAGSPCTDIKVRVSKHLLLLCCSREDPSIVNHKSSP